MRVEKRNGELHRVSYAKIEERLMTLVKESGVPIDDLDDIVHDVIAFVCEGIKTSEIDEISARILMSNSIRNPYYQEIAGRVVISNHQKNTSVRFGNTFWDRMNSVQYRLNPDFYEWVTRNKDSINELIDYPRDYKLDFFGFKTLQKSYFLKDLQSVSAETAQDLFMRVAIGIHYRNTDSMDDNIRETYQLMSNKYMTHASPTLFNMGTKTQQGGSCFLLQMSDSLGGIFDCISNVAMISKYAGGIGLGMSDVRGPNQEIHGTSGKTSGIIPIMRILNDTAVYVNQGGRRPGSVAVYLEPHHPDILAFLDVRKPQGLEARRARDLFTAVWLSDLFIERVRTDAQWSLLDPAKCPNLTTTFGAEYKQLYELYEAQGNAEKTIRARDLWEAIVTSMIETGTPYVLCKDAVNECSNQSNIGTVKTSNLCCEITEVSTDSSYAMCTLGSLCLSKCLNSEGTGIDYSILRRLVRQMVINLDTTIDYNHYPVKETETHQLYRPIGIGVQGLSDLLAQLRIPYESDQAIQLDAEIHEAMYYFALEKSCELARAKGTHALFDGSPLSRGKFHFEMFQDRVKTPVTLSGQFDWDSLRHDIQQFGVRNSLLIALMPTASTSQIMGNVESFEPLAANIFTRKTQAGSFIVMNKYMIADLEKLGMWTAETRDSIIDNDGSVQHLNIPQDIKALYKTVWETRQRRMIDHSAARAPFVDQSQSLNLYFQNATFNNIHAALMYGHSKGLKTLSYYTRSMSVSGATKITLDTNACDGCSG